jgi:V8-like Glu-specific endopeptidase
MADAEVTHERASEPPPPLTVDGLLKLDNVLAEKKPPARVARQLATRRVYLSGARTTQDIDRVLREAETLDKAVVLSLPGSIGIGLPGRASDRVTAADLEPLAGTAHTGKGLKPEWAPLTYHPKLGARPAPKVLRRFDGRRVTPTDNQSFLYGPDNRQVYYPQGYPWRCIGKVDVYPNGNADNPTEWGSGVLIGDRIVLTAGHVAAAINPSDWKIRFTAGMYNGSAVDGPGAVSYVSDARWLGDGVSGHDYAVLRLYDPIGTSLGYYGWKTYSPSWNGGNYWFLAGYPFDVASAQSPSMQNGIAVLDDDADIDQGMELEHHGDTASGDSGGPFFGFWDGDPIPYVVGTTSGHETIGGPSWTGGEDNNIEAAGGLMSLLLHWARDTWPA